MILKSVGAPLSLWIEVSKRCSKYKHGECDNKWRSFNRNCFTIGSLFVLAKEGNPQMLERISPELQQEILQAIARPLADGYRLPRLSTFCGQFIHHSGWRPDYTLRLVRRQKAGFTDHFLHAHMTVQGSQADLQYPIIHFSYRDLRDVLDKLDRYSSGNALDMAKRSLPSKGLGQALSHGIWAFIRTYILRAGFLDGSAGLMLAIYNAECTYYKYLKARAAIKQSNPEDA